MKCISNKIIGMWLLLITLGIFTLNSGVAQAGDPNGAETYSDSIGGLKYAVNFTWTLLGAFLVFSMQAGFTFLGGFLRQKNMLGYMAHCFIDSTLGAVVFYLFGFALMFGGSKLVPGLDYGNSFIGWDGFFLSGRSYDVQTIMFWLFQMVFATKTVSIIAGAVAERMKFVPYLIYSCLMCGLIYPIYGHWVWGGGWLGSLPIGAGVKDFAGCATVHTVGGIMALVGAWALGPRNGKYNPDGSPNAIPGHNLVYVVIGTLILAFGWFGFNAGSTLAATDLRMSVIASNTFIAASTGASIMIFFTWARMGVVDLPFVCNGALAGLVAITAPCAYVAPWAAAVIGLLAGLAMRCAFWFVEAKMKIDDPLGAVAVHAANGIWGMIAVGIFADGTYGGVSGLITGSGSQLLAQFIGTLVAIGWSLAWGCAVFFSLKYTIGIRVSDLVESDGVDIHIHGSPCYPVEPEFIAPVIGEEEVDIQQEKRQASLLEEALSRDADREKIYSDKLGRWVYARLKTDTKRR
ncbi:MAG: Ammonium transporter [Candidatus Jettenia ecosi]|uniref:Ammonium transporter n=1 Tax=Candidatus Jettenia ecosi TaxID=2494326 RepID=A0A533QCG8_9BACT|nr:MAG: Ammonium transporter [Candidatus Jettenia ecosi]